MKIFATSAAALLAATALVSTAQSADMPTTYAAPTVATAPAPVLYNWSGVYVGVHAGHAWADHDFRTSFGDDTAEAVWGPATDAEAYNGAPSVDSDGFLGGAQIGYDHQLGAFVAGLEADISWSDIDGSMADSREVDGFSPSTTTASADINWFATLRGRLGVTPTEQVLIYATGGLIVADVDYRYSFDFPGEVIVGERSDTEAGWTAGAGVEFAAGQNWSIRAEYLYFDLGETTFQAAGLDAAASYSDFNVEADAAGHIVRAGINYRFNLFGKGVPY